jgi:Flp pilus assembly protein TadG
VASVKLIVALPAVLMLSWLSVEIGFALRAYAQAKTAADAVALAAAARYPDGPDAARQDALTAALANKGPNGPVALVLVEGRVIAGGGLDAVAGCKQ